MGARSTRKEEIARPFFLTVSLRVTHDGLSERGATRSLRVESFAFRNRLPFKRIRFQQTCNTIACLQFDHVQWLESTTERFALQLRGEFNWKYGQIGLHCSLCIHWHNLLSVHLSCNAFFYIHTYIHKIYHSVRNICLESRIYSFF